MTTISTVNVGELANAMLADVKSGHIVFLTGPSGSGKDYIAAKVMKNPKLWVYLDQFGVKSGTKWEVKLTPEAAKAKVFVGHCSNFEEVVKTVLKAQPTAKVAVYLVDPSPELLRQSTAAKAKDSKGKNPEWVAGWLRTSKLSDAKAAAYIKDRTNQIVLHLKNALKGTETKFVQVPNPLEREVKSGWHKPVNPANDEGTAVNAAHKEAVKAEKEVIHE
jgi:ABC-type Fe3+/spermidine/putrescine transport system ATPase subunit